MHIREIYIENIRCFGEGEQGVHLDLTRPDGSLAGWTVIAGVNGSGKTTFLRAVALSVAALSTVLQIEDSYEGWVRHGASNGHTRALVVKSPDDEFKRGKAKPTKPLPASFWTGIRWIGGPEDAIPTAMVELNRRGRGAPLLGPCAEKPLGWFIAGYGPYRRLTGAAQAAERLMSGPNRLSRLVSLFREDASLIESVNWIQQLDYRSKEEKRPGAKAAQKLKQDVLRMLDDGLLPHEAKVDRVDSDGLWVKRGGLSLLLTQLSDGYRAVTALVLDIIRNIHEAFGSLDLSEVDGRPVILNHGVVLIDEVDDHLHVSWQKQIGVWLKTHFPNVQFIVTTHSPFICQAADPGGLIRLAAPGDPRPVGHVSQDVYNTVVNGSADDAVMTELFGEQRPYSDASEELREEISELESRLIQGTATRKEKARLERLSAQLPSNPSAQVERALLKLTAKIDATLKKS